MLKHILLLSGIIVSMILLWFAITSYRGAFPLAEENLRGLALSLSAAVESSAAHDPSLHSLSTFHPKDLAFLAIADSDGLYRFHSNPDLIGSKVDDARYATVLQSGESIEGRFTLGTAETVYEFLTPFRISRNPLILHLGLHTYRADAVIRKAKLNMTILLSLLLAGWIFSAVIHRFVQREKMHQLALAKQESLAKLGEMGAMLAHEIRNPLGGIKGFAQVITKKPTDERNNIFAERIVAEVTRLETLVSNLLTYAKVPRTEYAPVTVDDLMAHALSLIKSEANERHIAIKVDCPAGTTLVGDKNQLGQVMLNLLKNAIQAMPDGGTLSVISLKSGKQVAINIADTGEGIDQDDLDKVFEPFYSTKAQGTGLGLALCKKIVEEHGGTIAIKSIRSNGTTVTMTFPSSRRSK